MSERQPNSPPIPDPQHTPHEGGNGSLGFPPSINELAKPPPESGERHPLPSVLNLLKRQAEIYECRRRNRTNTSIEDDRKEIRELDNQMKTLAEEGGRNKLVYDLYYELFLASPPEESLVTFWTPADTRGASTRRFIRSARSMKDETLVKLTRTFQRGRAWREKVKETRATRLFLTPEQLEEKRREEKREYARRYRQKRKEQRRLQAESQQPTQVFPDPPQE